MDCTSDKWRKFLRSMASHRRHSKKFLGVCFEHLYVGRYAPPGIETVEVLWRKGVRRQYQIPQQKIAKRLLHAAACIVNGINLVWQDISKIRQAARGNREIENLLGDLGVILITIGCLQMDLAANSRKLKNLRGGKPNRSELLREAKSALSQAEINYPNHGREVQLKHAADSLGISPRQLRTRLKF